MQCRQIPSEQFVHLSHHKARILKHVLRPWLCAAQGRKALRRRPAHSQPANQQRGLAHAHGHPLPRLAAIANAGV